MMKIANSCSKEIGQALYEARSLLESYYGISEFTESEEACSRNDNRNDDAELADVEIYISPNPSSGIFMLDVNNENIEIEGIRVMNQSGKLVKEINYSKQIDLTQHMNGIYFVECLFSDGSRFTQKVILIK